MFEYLKGSDVPQKYIDLSGTECKFCGSPIIVNERRTVVKCSNPHCIRKISGCIDDITTKAGIKNVGEATCLAYVRENKYEKITDFLKNPPSDIADYIHTDMKKIQTLTDAVTYLCLPGLKEKISKLTDKFQTMEELLSKFETEDSSYWKEFGEIYQYGKDYSNLIYSFFSYIEDMYEIDNLFPQLKQEANKQIAIKINICITEHISSQLIRKQFGINPSKDTFVSILNKMFSPYGITFIKKSSVTSDTNYVVSDGPGNTTKGRIGRERGILITSDELILRVINAIKEASKNG